MNILHVGSCEVGEIRNSANAVGYSCSRTASTQCFDCGSSLCESHTETCGICNGIFCPSCLSFHSVQHSRRISRPQGTSGTKKGLKITELRLREFRSFSNQSKSLAHPEFPAIVG